jgi:hypothetical protein
MEKGLLEDLTLEMMEMNQTSLNIEKKISISNDYLSDVNANSWASFEQLHIIAGILSGNKLAALEKAKEDGAMQQRILDALNGINANTKEKKVAKELDTNVGGLGGLGALAFGFVRGYVEQFIKTAKAFYNLVKGVISGFKNAVIAAFDWITESKLGKFIKGKVDGFLIGISNQFDVMADSVKNLYKDSRLERVVLSVKDFFTGISDKFKDAKNVFMESNLVVAFREIWSDLKNAVLRPFRAMSDFVGEGALTKATDFLKDVYKKIIDPIFDVGARLDDMKGFFVSVKNTLSGWVTDIFAKVKGVLGGLGGADSILGKVGKFFGKLFAPIGFIMTLWDTVQGSIEGYEKGGVFGAVKGALSGLLNSLIGAPLNMLKDLVSWVAEKLGFSAFSATLDSFDFVSLIKNGIEGIFNWFSTLFSDPGTALSKLWNNLVGEGGLMDLLFKPIDMLINWVLEKFSFKAPEDKPFSVGNIMRGIWNGIIDGIADFVNGISWMPASAAEKIRSLKAGTATVDVISMATPTPKSVTPEKTANATGETLNTAAAASRDTAAVGEAARDVAMINQTKTTRSIGTGGSGGGNISTSSISNITVSTGSLPDRTDWSVMSGGFGVAV